MRINGHISIMNAIFSIYRFLHFCNMTGLWLVVFPLRRIVSHIRVIFFLLYNIIKVTDLFYPNNILKTMANDEKTLQLKWVNRTSHVLFHFGVNWNRTYATLHSGVDTRWLWRYSPSWTPEKRKFPFKDPPTLHYSLYPKLDIPS